MVFGTSSSLPLLVTDGGGLVCESVGNADLLSYHFKSKQAMEAVDLPLIAIRLLVLRPLLSGDRSPKNSKKSCFVVNAHYLPLYCLEQCPKVS